MVSKIVTVCLVIVAIVLVSSNSAQARPTEATTDGVEVFARNAFTQHHHRVRRGYGHRTMCVPTPRRFCTTFTYGGTTKEFCLIVVVKHCTGLDWYEAKRPKIVFAAAVTIRMSSSMDGWTIAFISDYFGFIPRDFVSCGCLKWKFLYNMYILSLRIDCVVFICENQFILQKLMCSSLASSTHIH